MHGYVFSLLSQSGQGFSGGDVFHFLFACKDQVSATF